MTGLLEIPNNKIEVTPGAVQTGMADEVLAFGDAVLSTDGGYKWKHATGDADPGLKGVVLKRGDQSNILSGTVVAVQITGLVVVEATDEVKDGEICIFDGSSPGDVKKGADDAELSTVFGLAKKGNTTSGKIIVEVL